MIEEEQVEQRLEGWRSVGRRGVIYLGLATLSIAQPILDLIGSNPELLASTKNASNNTWFFVVLIVLGPPTATLLIVTLVSSISERAGRLAHGFALSGFMFLFGLALLRTLGLSADFVVYVSALAIAGLATWMILRYRAVLSVASYMAWLAPAVAVLFFFSASGEAIRSSDPLVSNAAPTATPPIILMAFDEMPLYSILNEDLEIDSTRFPGLAALAADATWYPNASTPSNYTPHAIPSMLAGVEPERDRSPFAAFYPQSIFTLLGNAYDMNVYESTTSICPRDLCDPGQNETPSGFTALLRDAGVVYAHRVLPESSRTSLPEIDKSWGNFSGLNEDSEEQIPEIEDAEVEPERDLARFDAEVQAGPLRQGEILLDVVDNSIAAVGPTLTVYHGLLPHRPWRATPDGRTYRPTVEPMEGDTVYDDIDLARELYQRYLMQLAYLDSTVLEAVGRLKESGIWSEAIVIAVADHGISFEPGFSHRGANFDSSIASEDLFRVPLFVKMPGQVGSGVNWCSASTLDLLPTIAMQIGIDPGWEWKGTALKQCAMDTPRFVSALSNPWGIATEWQFDEAGLRGRVERYAEFVDPASGLGAYARIGASGDLVGEELETGIESSIVVRWSTNEGDLFAEVAEGGLKGTTVPAQITGSVELAGETAPGTEFLLTLDGVAVAVITELGGRKPGAHKFSAIADVSLIDDPLAQLGLVVRLPDGGLEWTVPYER